MNEIAIRQFVEQTADYLQRHQDCLEPAELDSVTELYQDLTSELERQQLFDDLYD